MRKVLQFAVVVESATGVGLILVPALVVPLLVRGEVSGVADIIARVLGITLLALGLACWPAAPSREGGSAAVRGMLTYNALVALFLAYAGAMLHLGGPLLWPSVALHGAVAVLLGWRTMSFAASPNLD